MTRQRGGDKVTQLFTIVNTKPSAPRQAGVIGDEIQLPGRGNQAHRNLQINRRVSLSKNFAPFPTVNATPFSSTQQHRRGHKMFHLRFESHMLLAPRTWTDGMKIASYGVQIVGISKSRLGMRGFTNQINIHIDSMETLSRRAPVVLIKKLDRYHWWYTVFFTPVFGCKLAFDCGTNLTIMGVTLVTLEHLKTMSRDAVHVIQRHLICLLQLTSSAPC